MVMVFGQMNELPGSRFRVGHTALTMAEYFRDNEHRDVLLLIDNIFRFVQAGSEVSGLMGRMPSRLGYQPTMGSELWRSRSVSKHQGRGHHRNPGCVCAGRRLHRSGCGTYLFPSVRDRRAHAPASQCGAFSGGGPAAIRLQDAHTGYRRGGRHYRLAQEIRRTFAQYAQLKDIIAMLGIEQLSQQDRDVVGRARRRERSLSNLFSRPDSSADCPGRPSVSRTPWQAASGFCTMSSRTFPRKPCT